MLIGNGLVARSFDKYKNNSSVIIFASGVSNSQETETASFNREETLLLETISSCKERTLVYFSTCSIYDISTRGTAYVQHKLKMERLVKEKCSHFYIFRLSQVVGKSSSPTLINYLFDAIRNKRNIKINEYSTRNLIHIDDVFSIAEHIIENKVYLNEITNIASGFNILVMDIIRHIEGILNITALYTLVEYGNSLEIDVGKIRKINCAQKLFNDEYIENILGKYNEEFSRIT